MRREPYRTPVPQRDRETATKANGPVITYQLSPEELEKYRNEPRQTYKRPTGLPSRNNFSSEKQSERAKKRYEGAGDMANTKLTKEIYLQQRLEGKGRTAIQKDFGMSTEPFYKLLGEWGIREMAKEEGLLKTLGGDQEAAPTVEEPKGIVIKPGVSGVGKTDPNRTYEALKAFSDEHLKSEIERLKADNVKAVAMAGQAAEKFQAEIDRLKDDNDVLSRDLTNLENELAEVVNQRDALKIANDTIKADYERLVNERDIAMATAEDVGAAFMRGETPDGYLTIRIPIIADADDRFGQIKKVYEELEEVGAEIEASNIDRRKAAGELYDLVQAFAGLIRAELADLVVNGSVDGLLQEFFDHHNRQHVDKIQRYAAERGWRIVG